MQGLSRHERYAKLKERVFKVCKMYGGFVKVCRVCYGIKGMKGLSW